MLAISARSRLTNTTEVTPASRKARTMRGASGRIWSSRRNAPAGRRTAATIQTTERTKPSIVTRVHNTRAGSSAPKSQAMPPVANQSTADKSKSSSFMSSNGA